MQDYGVTLQLLLQGSAKLTLREWIGAPVEKWLDVELPKVQNLRMDLLGETACDLNHNFAVWRGYMVYADRTGAVPADVPTECRVPAGAQALLRRFHDSAQTVNIAGTPARYSVLIFSGRPRLRCHSLHSNYMLNRGYAYTTIISSKYPGQTLLSHLAGLYPHSTPQAWQQKLNNGEVTLNGHFRPNPCLEPPTLDRTRLPSAL
jgi:hypothetical protein